MHPILIDLGTYDLPLLGETPIYLPTYGVMFALAVLAGWWWFSRRARSLQVDEETLFNLTFYTVLAAILGAKLLLVVVEWRTFVLHPSNLFGLLRSAGVLIGGVLAGALTFSYYAVRKGLPLHRLGDAVAAPLILGQAIGRLGCFLGGCCWGKQVSADNPIAVTFTDPRATTGVPLNRPLVPTQLIEFGIDMLLVLLLTWLWRRDLKPAGTVFWVYVLLYSVARGVIEFWRGDVGRGVYLDGLISTSQILSVGGVLLALVMLAYGWQSRRQTASA